MPRQRVYDKYIIQVLLEEQQPMRFTEIKKRLSARLNRTILNRTLAINLDKLEEEGIVERVLDKEGIKYQLTQQFFSRQAVETIKKCFDQMVGQPIFAGLHEDSAPFLVFGSAEIDALDNPNEIIAYRMWKEIKKYPPKRQEKAGKLLLWAYWAGVQAEFSSPLLIEALNRNEEFSEKNREKSAKLYEETGNEEFLKRMQAEENVLKIVGIVRELMGKANLKEFLGFLLEKEDEVRRLSMKFEELMEGSLGSCETLFNSFLNFHGMILQGLKRAEMLKENETIFFENYGEVWNAFFRFILKEKTEWTLSVKGNLENALKMLSAFKDGLNILLKLPEISKIMIVYLWGFSEIELLGKKSFLPIFEKWLKALKNGFLDHRNYLFSSEVERRLLKARDYVAKGKAPLNEKIDYAEPWTLRDLYEHHPRGRDPAFYEEILEAIKDRQPYSTL
ncbi:MAG: hypothetical protein LM601_09665 [Candidatus Verstraetearchaeota archaeon]|nr:hypothetical protein [Candidatus Verstraetearchaeota archaeon]